jgi:predicted MarR family transcription regulator
LARLLNEMAALHEHATRSAGSATTPWGGLNHADQRLRQRLWVKTAVVRAPGMANSSEIADAVKHVAGGGAQAVESAAQHGSSSLPSKRS